MAPFCVGLTGGIGSGKSTAADLFAALGAAVVDTDAISHALTRAGGESMGPIREAFGAEYIATDGGLDRPRMRERVFSDVAAKARLEAIVHPMIRASARKQVEAARAPYVILVVPLLLETGAYRDLVRRVLVVDCSEARQVERATARSKLAPDAVRAIMAAQMPRAERRALADDVLDNDGDLESLRRQVGPLHSRYLGLARMAGTSRPSGDPGKPQ
jgi:dephospho-CoA kinase